MFSLNKRAVFLSKIPFSRNIEKASAENGHTVEELFNQAADLDTKKVQIRGKVVKVSPNIMGKNWITLQDGTGTPPNNKLVVTSLSEAAVGDEVVVTGKVKNNVDIGAGYVYAVLLEEASFKQ